MCVGGTRIPYSGGQILVDFVRKLSMTRDDLVRRLNFRRGFDESRLSIQNLGITEFLV